MFPVGCFQLVFITVSVDKKGIVISDLHLLSARSEGESRFEREIRPRLNEIDTLVLNGDTFDFRWACRPLNETVPEAITWIQNLRCDFPDLEICYLLGNHDCLSHFVNELRSLERISIHAHILQLGRNLFLHGDAANYRMGLKQFQKFRDAWETDQPKSKRDARLYDLTDKVGLSYLTHALWFAGNTAVRRISWHLDRVSSAWREDADNCFFGHTHMPIKNRLYRGIRFYNTGSGIRGMEFAPATFSYPRGTLNSPPET